MSVRVRLFGVCCETISKIEVSIDIWCIYTTLKWVETFAEFFLLSLELRAHCELNETEQSRPSSQAADVDRLPPRTVLSSVAISKPSFILSLEKNRKPNQYKIELWNIWKSKKFFT